MSELTSPAAERNREDVRDALSRDDMTEDEIADMAYAAGYDEAMKQAYDDDAPPGSVRQAGQ